MRFGGSGVGKALVDPDALGRCMVGRKKSG